MSHRTQYRVYYEDTDAGGVVYYANYLKFAERARTEWLRDLGFDHSELRRAHGLLFVVRHVGIDYLSPARLDDLITVETRLHETGKVRMTLHQSMECEGRLLARMQVTIVLVSEDGRPARFPDFLTQTLGEPALRQPPATLV